MNVPTTIDAGAWLGKYLEGANGDTDLARSMLGAFAEAIMAGQPITVFDGGTLRRDFTYIDDIVAGVVGSLDRPPSAARCARTGWFRNRGCA